MFRRKLNIIALVLCFALILTMLSFAVYEPFKVKLTLFERFVTLSLLPLEGNYITLKIINDLRMELAVTEEEAALAELFPVEGGGTDAEDWDAVPLKEIIFGDIAKALIVDALTELNDKEKLTQQHVTLYEKFVTYAEKSKEGD